MSSTPEATVPDVDRQQTGALDEALDRLQHTGPEWHGRLSNHGPMVVEAMVRNGHSDEVSGWVDWYAAKLDALPHASERIRPEQWREALGDPTRIGDWLEFFEIEMKQQPWEDVLIHWWPRLLPGLAASATHSVIRLGHAVQANRTHPASETATREIGQSLAYWAARWLPVPASAKQTGNLDPSSALESLPHMGERDFGFADCLAELATDVRWPSASATLRSIDDPVTAQQQLFDLVTAATLRYQTHGHGDEIMLVHAATAPNAVARILPSLPHRMWAASVRTAWAASAAITLIYNPEDSRVDTTDSAPGKGSRSAEDTFAQAVEHGDEHVIKFTDAALDVFTRTSNPSALAAAQHAITIIERDS
ncbi:MAG TPA: questin oxidase family protein [Actinomycetes bacterium]|nr:questin oxidase family protein [Actinomycetes bacterium]